MEPSQEMCQLIVKHTSQRSDLCVLARVSKLFQHAAERALYNTVYMQDPDKTIALCDVISTRCCLPTYVKALTVTTHDGDVTMPEKYWSSLAGALQKTSRLRSLIFHIDGNIDQAWILRDCTFQLHTFHCDFSWDADLVSFLNTQKDMLDLYISDYRPPTSYNPSIDPQSLPRLATIESNYNEGIRDLVPGRPILRVKTCFSRESDAEKKEELLALTAALMRSKRSLISLDLADATYTEHFSLVVLQEVSRSLPHLRYLGTIVLPIGKEVNDFSILRSSDYSLTIICSLRPRRPF